MKEIINTSSKIAADQRSLDLPMVVLQLAFMHKTVSDKINTIL
jgi:hypothetical protein